MKRSSIIYISVALLLIAFSFWILIHPSYLVLKFERGDTSRVDNFYFGPYPTDEEFVRLQEAKVTRIVSLLDSRVPYEAVLLENERKLAKQFHIEVVNYPLGSIFSQRLPGDYEGIVKSAVDDMMAHKYSVTYVHCYLGKHRTQYVKNEFLKRLGKPVEPLKHHEHDDEEFAREYDSEMLLASTAVTASVTATASATPKKK